MKYFKTLNQYKCSNLVYDANSETAYSYKWYQIAARINGIMVVNDYAYSHTTATHAGKIKRLFAELSISYITIEAPRGLQLLSEAKPYYLDMINHLQAKIDNPRSKKTLWRERYEQLTTLKEKLAIIEGLTHASI